MEKFILLVVVFFSINLYPQQWQNYPELEAQPVGGKEEVEQVLQTQLYLAKPILTSNFDEEITILFDLDTMGNAIHIKFTKGMNNVLRSEITRLLGYFKFSKSQSASFDQYHYPYWYSLKLSTDKYRKYYKQRNNNKLKSLPADSSMVIYNKADRSPEYYKNGDEGLSEFILSEIEYPKVAKERSIEGTVIVEFVVETNGYVTTSKIKEGVNGGCSEEALRIIKTTRWQPAELKGKFVRYKMTYPITFSLINVSKDRASAAGQ